MNLCYILLKGWSFWNFSQWKPDETSAFWTAMGAIGTVGTLIYVLIDARRNRNKINDLANVAKAISDQNELIMVQNSLLIEQDNQQKREMKAKVKPDVSCNVATRGEPENLIILKLSNESHTARITNIEFDESQITFIKRTTPFELKKNERVDITGKSNSKKNISLCNQLRYLPFHPPKILLHLTRPNLPYQGRRR